MLSSYKDWDILLLEDERLAAQRLKARLRKSIEALPGDQGF